MSGQIWSLRWTQRNLELEHMNLDRTTGKFQLCVVSACVLYPWWNCSSPNYSVLNSLACFPSQYYHILQLLALDKETIVRGMSLDRSKQDFADACFVQREELMWNCVSILILVSGFAPQPLCLLMWRGGTLWPKQKPSALIFSQTKFHFYGSGKQNRKPKSQLERADHHFANVWLVFFISRNVRNANYTAIYRLVTEWFAPFRIS